MTKILLIIVSLFVGLSTASANDEECTLNVADLKSPLNLKVKYYKSKTPVMLDDYGIFQSVVLKNGQEVAYQAGGCHHYSYTIWYSYVNKDLKALSNVELSKLAVELLNSTPMVLSKKYEKQIFIDAIDESIKSGLISDTEIVLQCGDATCALSTGENNSIYLSYDFAL